MGAGACGSLWQARSDSHDSYAHVGRWRSTPGLQRRPHAGEGGIVGRVVRRAQRASRVVQWRRRRSELRMGQAERGNKNMREYHCIDSPREFANMNRKTILLILVMV